MTVEKAIKSINELKTIQGMKGNIDQGDYMVGLYNGLELALSILEKREADFKNCKDYKEV